MEARVVTRVTINASPAVVFRYFADTHHHSVWNPHIEEVRPLGKLSEGQVYEAVSTVLGVKLTAQNKVEKLVPRKEFEVSNETGLLHYCVNYHLEVGAKGQTCVVCTIAVTSLGKAFAFARPVLESMARRELQTDLQALKRAVEGSRA